MFRLFAAIGFLFAFAGAAPWVVPMGRQAFNLVRAQDDAARIADLQLAATLDAPRVSREIEEALATDDAELATSFVELADARGIVVDPVQRARVALADSLAAAAMRSAGSAGMGFLTGEGEDLAGLAGAATGDLFLWGDVRDLGREGLNWARGEEPDTLIVALATAGVGATAATWTLGGTPITFRAGLSLVKGARRIGVMSLRLGDDLLDLVKGGRKMRALSAVADLGTTVSKAGARATFAGLRHVDDVAGAARLRRLAEVKGGQTLAIFKTLGRGALFLTEALARLAFWIMALVIDVIGLIVAFNAMVVALVRPLWRRKRRAVRRQAFSPR